MVTGSAGPVQFESSDTSIVTVTNEGLVTGWKVGAALIVVSARSNPQLRGAVQISVRSRGLAKVAIQRLVQADSSVEASGGFRGTVVAHVEFTRGDAVMYQLLVDSAQACSGSLTRTTAGDSLPRTERTTCAINTAAYDSTKATPSFLNGSRAVTARLLSADGRVLARSEPVRVQLENRDTTVVTLSSQNRATDRNGKVWIGGEVVVEALPLLFGGGRVESVHFKYRTPDGLDLSSHADGPPFMFVLPSDVLAGQLDPQFRVEIASRRENGISGPTGASPMVGYDAVPPTPGGVVARPWIGADFVFASAYSPSLVPDQGVGRVAPAFYSASSDLLPEAVLASGSRVAVGSDLTESGPFEYRLAYRVCDALQNCVPRAGFDFGVDLNPPAVSSISLGVRAVNPQDDLQLTVTDGRSGLPDRPVLASVQHRSPVDDGSIICGPVVGAAKLPGRAQNDRCVAEPAGSVLAVPKSGVGYYFYRLAVRDIAGNQLELPERIILVDHDPPEIVSLEAPAQLRPGSDATVKARLSDNVDLAYVEFRYSYGPDGVSLPFSGRIEAGKPFTGAMSRTYSATASLPFIRTLTSLSSTSATTALVSTLQVRVVDAAGFPATRSLSLDPSAFDGNVSIANPFGAISEATVLASGGPVCTAGCTPSDALTLPVTIQITGDAGLGAFARMFLFARGADGVVTSLGSTAAFAVMETGTQRTYTYTFNSPPPAGMRGKFSVFAVAVTNAGNGLKTTETPVELYTR